MSLFGGGFPLDFFIFHLVGVDSPNTFAFSFSLFLSWISHLSYPQFCARFVCTSCSHIEEATNKNLVVMSYYRVYGESCTGRVKVQQVYDKNSWSRAKQR